MWNVGDGAGRLGPFVGGILEWFSDDSILLGEGAGVSGADVASSCPGDAEPNSGLVLAVGFAAFTH